MSEAMTKDSGNREEEESRRVVFSSHGVRRYVVSSWRIMLMLIMSASIHLFKAVSTRFLHSK